MARKVPVRLPERRDQLKRQAIQDRADRRARHAVAAVQHDLQPADLVQLDERASSRAERIPAFDRLDTATSRCGRQPAINQIADLADPGVAGERDRALSHQLRARVGLRIVRGRADQAAVELARADEEVDDLGRDLPGVEHVDPLGDQPVAVAGRQLGRAEAHVVAERDAQLRGRFAGEAAEHAGEGAADLLGGGPSICEP